MKIDVFNLPIDFINLILIVLFSLIIGLSQRKLHSYKEDRKVFGTDRTFTFIGLLGFILYSLDKTNMIPYLIGFVVLSFYLGIFYIFKIKEFSSFGLTSILIGLLTYSLTPIIYVEPKWLVILIVVTVLFFTEIKVPLSELSSRFEKDEFISLGKFLIIAGVVLPVLPDVPLVDFVSITPYRIWLAVVAISSISYLSYILQKFVFRDSGILISGVLGGLYSSTATTFVMAKLSKSDPCNYRKYAGAIIIATAMMYFRIMVLVIIFNQELAKLLAPYFLFLTIISFLTSIVIYKSKYKLSDEQNDIVDNEISKTKNPLELKVSIVFTLLYVFFTFATYFTIKNFGNSGLNVLSFIVGVTDIDPFLLNLFQGKYEVTMMIIAIATLQATMSNNILKATYSTILSHKNLRKLTLIGFLIITTANVLAIILISLF
ncbi:MAG: DUF4010 domain-containing protein [Bacteroidota bacterium]